MINQVEIINNHSNEFLGTIKQQDFLTSIRGHMTEFISSKDTDPTGLGYWNFVDVTKGERSIRFITVHQNFKSNKTLGTDYAKRGQWFQSKNINEL